MGRKVLPIGLGVLLLTWLVWNKFQRSESQNIAEPSSPPAEIYRATEVTATNPVASSSTPSTIPSRTTVDAQMIQNPLEIPTLEGTREEVEKDPHTTPVSLLKFATTMAPKMEAALKDEKLATLFMENLSDCATGEGRAEGSLNPSAQALCYSNAKDLAKAFPNLKSAFQSLDEKTPELVKKRAL